jgi:bacterioferritin-associated ferredoxin
MPQPAGSVVTREQVVELIRQQQKDLADLRKKLESLAGSCESIAEQSIVMHLRETLEIPMRESLDSHEKMQQSLAQMILPADNAT